MTIFSVGPVEMYPLTREILGTQEPYFRTSEVSAEGLAIKQAFLQCVNAAEDTEFALLTASGTGAMEAAVTNVVAPGDAVIVINSGSFGARFVDLCGHAGAHVTQVKLPLLQEDLTQEALDAAYSQACESAAHTSADAPRALFVQACETSSGRKFDLALLGEFCVAHDMLFVVDAVSGFLCDPIDMQAQHIDVVLTASQKALSCSPGISLLAAGPRATAVIAQNHDYAPRYFDLPECFTNMQRGQTPFTCPVANVLALRERICGIAEAGVATEVELHAKRADAFRATLPELGFTLPRIPLSCACTPLVFPAEGWQIGAQETYNRLRYEFDLTLCPSGGAQADTLLRVGHMGNLHQADYDALVAALTAVRA